MKGKIFGRLFVLEYSHMEKKQNKIHYWKCLCRCGKEVVVTAGNLCSANTNSCGCLRKLSIKKGKQHPSYRHGHYKSRLYSVWHGLRGRCNCPTDKRYHRYGGRGIRVCERWDMFENFYADMGPTYKEGLSIDRINPSGDYTPENCQWLSMSENMAKAWADNNGTMSNALKVHCVTTNKTYPSIEAAARACNIGSSYLARKAKVGGVAKGLQWRML